MRTRSSAREIWENEWSAHFLRAANTWLIRELNKSGAANPRWTSRRRRGLCLHFVLLICDIFEHTAQQLQLLNIYLFHNTLVAIVHTETPNSPNSGYKRGCLFVFAPFAEFTPRQVLGHFSECPLRVLRAEDILYARYTEMRKRGLTLFEIMSKFYTPKNFL